MMLEFARPAEGQGRGLPQQVALTKRFGERFALAHIAVSIHGGGQLLFAGPRELAGYGQFAREETRQTMGTSSRCRGGRANQERNPSYAIAAPECRIASSRRQG